jgi:hypothetical protein
MTIGNSNKIKVPLVAKVAEIQASADTPSMSAAFNPAPPRLERISVQLVTWSYFQSIAR